MEPRGTDSPAPGPAGTRSQTPGYRVETSGRVLLPEVLEEQLLPALREELAGRVGRYDGAPTSGLEDVARAVGVRAVRDGDHVLLVTDRDGDPVWTEQSGAFLAALAGFVREGEVRLRGQDGAEWAVAYGPDGAEQHGVNGFDGSTTLPPARGARTAVQPPVLPPPPADPAGADSAGAGPVASGDVPGWPPAPQSATQSPPQNPAQHPDAPQPWLPADEPEPRSPARAFGMAVLFLGGVFLVLMIAIVASGLG